MAMKGKQAKAHGLNLKSAIKLGLKEKDMKMLDEFSKAADRALKRKPIAKRSR